MAKHAFIEGRLRELSLSQGEVAQRVGVTPGMVWQWATGRTPVSAKRAPSLAAVLECRPEDVSAAYEVIANEGASSGHLVGEDAFRVDVDTLEKSMVLLDQVVERLRSNSSQLSLRTRAQLLAAIYRMVGTNQLESSLSDLVAALVVKADLAYQTEPIDD